MGSKRYKLSLSARIDGSKLWLGEVHLFDCGQRGQAFVCLLDRLTAKNGGFTQEDVVTGLASSSNTHPQKDIRKFVSTTVEFLSKCGVVLPDNLDENE